jgi:hypothetical protein
MWLCFRGQLLGQLQGKPEKGPGPCTLGSIALAQTLHIKIPFQLVREASACCEIPERCCHAL